MKDVSCDSPKNNRQNRTKAHLLEPSPPNGIATPMLLI